MDKRSKIVSTSLFGQETETLIERNEILSSKCLSYTLKIYKIILAIHCIPEVEKLLTQNCCK